jgi:dolichyl-phosphate beta-glucosyltransferase
MAKTKKISSGKNEKSPFLSIIIPAYNEEKLICDTLKQVTEFLEAKPFSYEVIIVDDGSKDRTVEIAKKWRAKEKGLPVRVLENVRNRGKGFSVRKGFLSARGEYACFSDADLSTPICDSDKLLKWIEKGFDVAIGSRALKESNIDLHQPWWREIMGKTFNKFVQALAVKGIRDTQCGFKCFSRKAYTEVFKRQTIDGFGFDVEALFIARKLDFKIKEVPITWVNRIESRVNPILHPIQMLGELILIRFRDLMGVYK